MDAPEIEGRRSHYFTLAQRFLIDGNSCEQCCVDSSKKQPSSVRKLINTSWTVVKHISELARIEHMNCDNDNEEVIYPQKKHYRSDEIMSKLLAENRILEQVKEYIESEEPWHRVKRTFMEQNALFGASEQMQKLATAAQICLMGSFGFFFIQGMKIGEKDFKKKHAITMYSSMKSAQVRQMRHIVNNGFIRGFKMMIRTCTFALPLISIHHGLEVYWNKTTPLTLTVASGVVCSIWKLNLGPKGMFAGGVLGSVFGCIAGCVWYGMAKLTNETQEQMNYRSVKEMLEVKRNLSQGRAIDYREEVDDID